jgi:integrase
MKTDGSKRYSSCRSRSAYAPAGELRKLGWTRKAGIGHWHAHEGRRTAVSIMSSNGVPIQEISDTVGHKSTHVTETVCRHVIVPAIRGGASIMDDVFGEEVDTNEGSGNAMSALGSWLGI